MVIKRGKRGKKRAADAGDQGPLDLSTIICSLPGCDQSFWKVCEVCLEDVCQEHESNHACQGSVTVDDAQSSAKPVKRHRTYLRHQHHIAIYLGKKVGYGEAARLVGVDKSLIPRWTKSHDYSVPDRTSQPRAKSAEPRSTEDIRHLLPDERSIKENVLLFKYYEANPRVGDVFYQADFAGTAESSAPLPDQAQKSDDEESDEDAPYWQKVSETEIPQHVFDALKFLPDTYNMRIDPDVPPSVLWRPVWHMA